MLFWSLFPVLRSAHLRVREMEGLPFSCAIWTKVWPLVVNQLRYRITKKSRHFMAARSTPITITNCSFAKALWDLYNRHQPARCWRAKSCNVCFFYLLCKGIRARGNVDCQLWWFLIQRSSRTVSVVPFHDLWGQPFRRRGEFPARPSREVCKISTLVRKNHNQDSLWSSLRCWEVQSFST